MTDVAAPPPPPPAKRPARPWRGLFPPDSLLTRVTVVGIITLVLLLPLQMISGLVDDRQHYEAEAINSVTTSWGRQQTLEGVAIVLPYRQKFIIGPNDIRERDGSLMLLPEKLNLTAQLSPEVRRRGLFDVTLYSSTLDVVAEFALKSLKEHRAEGRTVNWAGVSLGLGLGDVGTIRGGTVEIDGRPFEWLPRSGAGPFSQLEIPLDFADLPQRETITVRFRLSLTGSDSLSFLPTGAHTEATVTSPWPSPSFIGRYLPSEQRVSAEGFRAHWSVPYLARGYGQLWDSERKSEPSADMVQKTAFGIRLLSPVGPYRETDRALKYGILFIGLTFAACLMLELATGAQPHYAQYGLIGLALCIFYLLLLSLSERIGFGPAYLCSAAAVAGQVAAYNWAVHRSRLIGLAFGGLLALLYGTLYGLLQLEDAALLSGSVLLFVVLSIAMWLTRNLGDRARA